MHRKTFLLPIIFMFFFIITCAFAPVTKAQTTQRSWKCSKGWKEGPNGINSGIGKTGK
jgi:hypothetical protein